MDHLFRRLIVGVFLIASGVFSCPSMADGYDGDQCPDVQFYMTRCDAPDDPGWSHKCYTKRLNGGIQIWKTVFLNGNQISDGVVAQVDQCAPKPPQTNPCAGMSPRPFHALQKMVNGETSCQPTPQPDGSSVKCGMVFTMTGQPMQNQWGSWSADGTLTPNGNLCGGDGTGGADWTHADGSPIAGRPPAGPPKPADIDPPKLCGGVSCYDPKSGQYCATGESGQVCVPGPPPGQSGGSCATGGDTTVCAGSPQAPKPDPAKVPDPPTQTKGTDQYTGASPTTGQLQNITVGTYNTGPGGVSSGASSTDTKPPAPASSSSVGKPDGTGASGGGDCSNPPSVSGSPALGMVATQAWQTRCAVDKGLNGTADAGDITTPSGKSAWVDTPSSGDPIADNANKGIYDISGMGFSTACPLHDLVVPLWWNKEINVPFSKVCDLLGWLKAIVIGFAIYYAGKITVGGTG